MPEQLGPHPAGLERLARTAAGRRWLATLPTVLDEVAERWSIEIAGPFEGSSVSWTAPAKRDGEDLVVKLQWPHDECRHEAAALAHWSGAGAVELLAHDPGRHALLLERAQPGTHLRQGAAADPVAVLETLLRQLSTPAGEPFDPLATEAERWADQLPRNWEAADRPCERRLVDAAVDWLRQLGPDQGEQVLVHQDLHGDNIVASQRQPWLAIDPKPVTGEREFALAPIVRSFELGHTAELVRYRLDRLTEALDLDRARSRGWAVGQTMAWSFDSDHTAQHHETVRWLLATDRS